MKKTDIFSLAEIALSSSLGVFGGAFAQNYVSGVEEWVNFGIAFLFVALVTLALNQYLTSYLRNEMLFVRSWSKNFIEGQWVQIIEDERLSELPPTKFSFIEITWQDGQFKVSGRSYNDAEGLQTTNFYSVATEYNSVSATLSYVYKFTTDEHHQKRALFGESSLVFGVSGVSRSLNKYKGVVHSNLRDDVRVLAIKVQKNQSFNFSNPTSRQKAVSSIREAFLC